jgi:MFS family permease
MATAPSMRQYALVTGNYWAFTLTDGALRMLVVLHFHSLGYDALQIALMFLFYELFGVITNLLGGYLGARIGLNRTMNIGLGLQLAALSMLLVSPHLLTVAWVMAAQAISGIAKDLNKMSAKSAIKLLIPSNTPTHEQSTHDQSSNLYRWVALLTGSKNALKGVGFFLGGALLSSVGFTISIQIMLIGLVCVWLCSLLLLKTDLGRSKNKPKIRQILSKSSAINRLSGARLCLFAARDVWFVVALPVYLAQQLSWTYWQVSSFLAAWVIGYGFVQALAPLLTRLTQPSLTAYDKIPETALKGAHKTALKWQGALCIIPIVMAYGLYMQWNNSAVLMIGLSVFGIVFAVNSSLHSYLIVALSNTDNVAMDVGFYYMANAAGRLLGTLLSGWVFLQFGFVTCLLLSAALVLAATVITRGLARSI